MTKRGTLERERSVKIDSCHIRRDLSRHVKGRSTRDGFPVGVDSFLCVFFVRANN
jgi:hypothetical protein